MNVLEDPWIPVAGEGGETVRVSYPDLMTGRVQARDLAHPLPEMRAAGCALLSALTQACFPLRDTADMVDALRAPRDWRPPAAFAGTARLLGDAGRFLQPDSADPAQAKDAANYTSMLSFADATTYGNTLWSRRTIGHHGPLRAVCASCAILALYALQAQAPQGGRGYSPSVCGSSRFFTLVRADDLRQTAHANTVPADMARELWPADGTDAPWRYRRTVKPGGAIGLLEGLFWTPRTLRFEAHDTGLCLLCGVTGPRVAVCEYAAGSKVEGGLWRSPFGVLRVKPTVVGKESEVWHMTTPARPAWAELAGCVILTPTTRPAPVVAQAHARGARRVEILLYGSRFDQTKWLGTLAEPAVLDFDLATHADRLVAEVDAVRGAVNRAVRAVAVNGEPSGALALDLEFWQGCETAFLAELARREKIAPVAAQFLMERKQKGVEIPPATPPVEIPPAALPEFERALRRTAWTTFQRVCGDEGGRADRAETIARARGALRGALHKIFNPTPPEKS